MQADTFHDFPTSLMSVGKTADDGTVSVFTKEGVHAFKEDDVLITCKGEPILIGVRDSHGQYRIPLIQQRGQWQPRQPSKQVREALRQANSVYDLPHVGDDTTCRSNFGQMGPYRRHKIEDVVAVCVGLSQHLPDFPKCVCRNILWYGSTYAQILSHPHAKGGG